MSEEFRGFASRDKLTPIPETFFAALLPLVDDLAELKVLLFTMWAVQQREGHYRFLSEADYAASDTLMTALQTARPEADPADTLRDALSRATERGALLCETLEGVDDAGRTLYFMNTERGREAVAAIEQGRYVLEGAVEILPPRPNVYRLYEQEIGPITPMIAEGLRDLEADYPAVWLPEAVRVAVEKQAKHLKFIRAVLERWRKEGKTDDEITGRHESGADDGNGRIGGKYADWIDQ